jgi:hypothetical protein
VGLRWEQSEAVSPWLGYEADGDVQVGLVRRWRRGFEGFYRRDGIAGLGDRVIRYRLGDWETAPAAMEAVDRHHERLSDS